MEERNFFRKFFASAATAVSRAEDDEDEEAKKARARRKVEDDDEEEEEARKARKAKARRKAEDEEDDEDEAEEDDEEEARKARKAKARRKAEDDDEEEDDDEKSARARSALMAKNPRLYRLIRDEGIAMERARIAEQTKIRRTFGADYKADATDAETVAGVRGSVSPVNDRADAKDMAAGIAAGIVTSARGYKLKNAK